MYWLQNEADIVRSATVTLPDNTETASPPSTEANDFRATRRRCD